MSALAGRVALVTGASSGMGAATAAALEAEGAEVWTAQRRGGPGPRDLVADLSDRSVPGAVIDTVTASAGRLDILINNAGMMREALAEDTSDADWDAQIALNLTTPFLLIRVAMPFLKASGSGAIVNIGSVEGLANNPGHAAYGASKAGLHGLTRAVAVDHGPDGVRCNAIAPGWIDTPLNEDYIEAMPDPVAFRAGLGGIHPVGRTGAPEDIAALVVWLVSDAAGFMTGQILTLDGGRMSKLSLP